MKKRIIITVSVVVLMLLSLLVFINRPSNTSFLRPIWTSEWVAEYVADFANPSVISAYSTDVFQGEVSGITDGYTSASGDPYTVYAVRVIDQTKCAQKQSNVIRVAQHIGFKNIFTLHKYYGDNFLREGGFYQFYTTYDKSRKTYVIVAERYGYQKLISK